MKEVNNPHVLSALDVKFSDSNIYLIFEYCNGGDLKKLFENKGGVLDE